VEEQRRVFLVQLRASVLPFVGEAFRGDPLNLAAHLRRVACGVDVSVLAVVDTLLAHPRVSSAALDIVRDSKSREAIIEFDPQAGLEVVGLDGQTKPVEHLSFVVVFNANRTEIPLTHGLIGEHAVSFGCARTDAAEIHFAAVVPRGERARVKIYEYRHQQESGERELVNGVDSDLQPLPDSTMRLIVGGCE
jgi:hypothetical protein